MIVPKCIKKALAHLPRRGRHHQEHMEDEVVLLSIKEIDPEESINPPSPGISKEDQPRTKTKRFLRKIGKVLKILFEVGAAMVMVIVMVMVIAGTATICTVLGLVSGILSGIIAGIIVMLIDRYIGR